jgi:hypothetical protein
MGWWYNVTTSREVFVAEADDKETAATELLSLSGEYFDNPSGPYADEEVACNEGQRYLDDLELDDE